MIIFQGSCQGSNLPGIFVGGSFRGSLWGATVRREFCEVSGGSFLVVSYLEESFPGGCFPGGSFPHTIRLFLFPINRLLSAFTSKSPHRICNTSSDIGGGKSYMTMSHGFRYSRKVHFYQRYFKDIKVKVL